MTLRTTNGWQLILADLALILFLVTLAALAGTGGRSTGFEGSHSEASSQSAATGAPVQALYRPSPDTDAFDMWLSDQPNDPRAQVTIYASYRGVEGQAKAWQSARAMAGDARASGLTVKVVITPGTSDDIYASIAFDSPPQLQQRDLELE